MDWRQRPGRRTEVVNDRLGAREDPDIDDLANMFKIDLKDDSDEEDQMEVERSYINASKLIDYLIENKKLNPKRRISIKHIDVPGVAQNRREAKNIIKQFLSDVAFIRDMVEQKDLDDYTIREAWHEFENTVDDGILDKTQFKQVLQLIVEEMD